MPPKEAQFAVMFADVAGSTKLYEKLGDTAAKALIGETVSRMSDITRRLGGTVVKTIGDEVMARFPAAEPGIIAAITIQEALEKNPPRGIPVAVRIGVHWGPALLENNDLFGNTVNIAARVAAIAKARQIITTEETVVKLGPLLQEKARLFDRTQVKGIQNEVVTHQIVWESHDEVTTLAPTGGFSVMLASADPLEVRCGEEVREMACDADAFTLGRADTCNLPVPSTLASRQHARIEFRRGRYILIDQSTNGTWVRLEDGKEVYLRREELQLWGRGVISLGGEVSGGDVALVYFKAPA